MSRVSDQPTLIEASTRGGPLFCTATACGASEQAAQRIAQHSVALNGQLEEFRRHMLDNDCGQQLAARSLALVVYDDLSSLSLLWLLGAPFNSGAWAARADYSNNQLLAESGVLLIVQLCDQLCCRVSEILAELRGCAARGAQLGTGTGLGPLLDTTPARLAQLASVVSVLRAISAIKHACRQRVTAMPAVVARQSAEMMRSFQRHARLSRWVQEIDQPSSSASLGDETRNNQEESEEKERAAEESSSSSDETNDCPVCSSEYDRDQHRPVAPLCCGAKQRICAACWALSAHASSKGGRSTTFLCPFCKAQLSLYGGVGNTPSSFTFVHSNAAAAEPMVE